MLQMDLFSTLAWWAVQATAILLICSIVDRFFIRRPECRKALIRIEIFILLILPCFAAMRHFGLEISLPVASPPIHAFESHGSAFHYPASEGHPMQDQGHDLAKQESRSQGQLLSLVVPILLFCGAIVRLIGLCRSVRSNSLIRARSLPIPPRWRHAGLIRNTATQFDVPIKFSNEVDCPCVVGFGFNSIVVLPDKVERLTHEAFRCILLHEMHHVRDRDAQWRLAQRINEVIYWWHPLLFALSAKLIQIDDDVSDSFAANHSRVEGVAEAIAEFTKLNLKNTGANLRPCYLNRRSDAVRRVKFLLDPRRSFMTRSSILFRTGVFTVALSCVVGAGLAKLQPAKAETNRPEEPNSQRIGEARSFLMTDESDGSFGDGVAAFYAGHHERAAKIFEALTKSTATDPLVHFYYAGTLNELGRHKEARNQLTLAIGLKPDFSEAYYHRGLTYRKLDQLDLAKADLNTIVSQKAAITHRALDTLAEIAIAEEDYDAAIRFASQSIDSIPTAGRPWYLRGQAHFGKGNADQAKSDMQRAFDLGYADGKL